MVDKEIIDKSKLQFVREICSKDDAKVSLYLHTTDNKSIIVKRGKANDAVYMCDEASIMQKLDHPNIVKYYQYDVSPNNIPRIFMEYISHSLEKLLDEDEKLKDTFHDKTIVNENHWKIAMGIAAGLHYLHSQLIVHCDMKPANILAMKEYNTIKICDFGLSSDLSVKDKKDVKWDKGSPVWVAPEIAAPIFDKNCGIPEDPYKIDIWALGQILLQLYINTGGKPYSTLSKERKALYVFKAIYNGEHDPIPEDKPLASIIAGCLVKEHAMRFDAGKVIEALDEVKNRTLSPMRNAN